jgi:AraC-like DNA-binding protein
MKLNGAYKPHLSVGEQRVSAGGEQCLNFPIWLMVQISEGSGYWLQSERTIPLDPGTVLTLPPNSTGTIRASQIGTLSFHHYCIDPLRLIGLITAVEQVFFKSVEVQKNFPLRVLPARHPLAGALREVVSDGRGIGSLVRLRLAEVFLRQFEGDLSGTAETLLAPNPDAKQRLLTYLKTTPSAELLNVKFSDLVELAGCTPRHFSRIFRELIGMSFRDKHSELRLSRACELLATTNFKILDVALESGYQSLSLFNLMFVRRFGASPGKWRRQLRRKNGTIGRPRNNGNRLLIA